MKVRYAIARTAYAGDYLKFDKPYYITKWNKDGTFKIKDEEGEEILCTLKECHHLCGGNWEIETLSCEVQDNVLKLPENFNQKEEISEHRMTSSDYKWAVE